MDLLPLGGVVAALLFFLYLDLHFFARGREPQYREAVVWSVGWLVLGLAVTGVVLVLEDTTSAVDYTTVYLIERSLSLDNLFVFILLFGYFGVPQEHRARLLFFGIVAALALRGLAIVGGIALIEQFHIVIYLLGILLLFLAYRILRGVAENVDPSKNLIVRAVRKIFPVTDDFRGGQWFSREGEGDKLHATPIFVCLAAIIGADIAFAIDSIPAAFAITREELIIFMGNVFALLGLRSLFVLVEGLIERFRYLNQTIAVVLALVAIKLLIEDLVKIGPGLSLAGVAVAFAVGIAASLLADRRDGGRPKGEPQAEREVQEAEASPAPREREPEPRA